MHATLKSLTHQVTDAHAGTNTGGKASTTIGVVCGFAHGVCSLQLSIKRGVEQTGVAEFLSRFGAGLKISDVESLKG